MDPTPRTGMCQFGAIRCAAGPRPDDLHRRRRRMRRMTAGAPVAAPVTMPAPTIRRARGTPAELESPPGPFRRFRPAGGTSRHVRRDGAPRRRTAIAAFDRAAGIPIAAEPGTESRQSALEPLGTRRMTSEPEPPTGPPRSGPATASTPTTTSARPGTAPARTGPLRHAAPFQSPRGSAM